MNRRKRPAAPAPTPEPAAPALPWPPAQLGSPLDACDAEHAAAIAITRCPICDALPGVDCTYGGRIVCQQFPGRAHTRRITASRRAVAELALRALELGGVEATTTGDEG